MNASETLRNRLNDRAFERRRASQQARRLELQVEQNRAEELLRQLRERSRFARIQEQSELQRKAEREDAAARRRTEEERRPRLEEAKRIAMKARLRPERREAALAAGPGTERRERDWRRQRLLPLPGGQELQREKERKQIIEQTRATRQAEALARKRRQDILEQRVRARRQQSTESQTPEKLREAALARHEMRLLLWDRERLLQPRRKEGRLEQATEAAPAMLPARLGKAHASIIPKRKEQRPRSFMKQKERLPRTEPASKARQQKPRAQELAMQRLEVLSQRRLREEKSRELLLKVKARQRLVSARADKQAAKSFVWRMREAFRREQKKIADVAAEERQAVLWSRHRLLRTRRGLARRTAGALSPLKTRSNRIVGRDGNSVRLRGVNVQGLDYEAFTSSHEFRRRLGLHERGLQVLSEHWDANLVRLTFDAGSLLAKIESSTGQQLLDALDEIVAGAARQGIYVLLSGTDVLPAEGTRVPGPGVLRCWRMLAQRYQQQPAVLYEIRSATGAATPEWPDRAGILISAIRGANAGSLIFVCENNVPPAFRNLPWGWPEAGTGHNLVYSADLPPDSFSAEGISRLRVLAHRVPVFSACWCGGAVESARLAHSITSLQQRLGSGYAAFNWNADPRVVTDAAADQFTPTPPGLIVRRALLLAARLHHRHQLPR